MASVNLLSEQEKNWIHHISYYYRPRFIGYLKYEFFKPSLEMQQQLCLNHMDIKAHLDKLAFYLHFEGFNKPERLIRLLSEIICSSKKVHWDIRKIKIFHLGIHCNYHGCCI